MRIPPYISEWLNLAARWFHVFAGILWVGTTFFFTWLDGRFTEEEKKAGGKGEPGEVWMVHSGGFYVVGKRKQPGQRELHWFRWEAALTWLSGVVLLVLLYYIGGESTLADTDVKTGFVRWLDGLPGQWLWSRLNLAANYGTFALCFGVGLLIVGWLIYDLLLLSPLGRNEWAFAAVAYLLVVCAAFASTHVLTGRAAFLHVGAMFGTIMVSNVWMRILPAQRRMIAATKRGEAPDASDAARAKLRSKHNTFMAVPVVFTMISNHYPVSTYGHEHNWLILSALVLVGWAAAKIIRRA
ncbi:MAG TPA: urate hydroxylase PuuD [Pyrinomonadaceae bacterium]|nr:urate hydroxylase PuuD [Pyrinomonadaceae bacterium]